MVSQLEEEFYKIIQPVIQRQDNMNLFDDCAINLDLIPSRDKINLINNIKLFIKTNLSNINLSVVFSKHPSIMFSSILFKSLDDKDQNVRIAADECINQIIRLTSNIYSPYIIYNLFVELKRNASPRSVNGALYKFSTMSHLIKHSKRQSYINNVLPVLQILLNRQEETVLISLVDCLPKIAETLFPFASDIDIESMIIIPLLRILSATKIIGHQRNLGQLAAIACANLKDQQFYLARLLQYCVSVNFSNEEEVRGSLFLVKSLLTLFLSPSSNDIVYEVVLVAIRLFEILEQDSSAAIKNLALDCLWHLLQLKNYSPLLEFFTSVVVTDKYFERMRLIDHELIFMMENIDNVNNPSDLSDLTDITVEEDQNPLFERYQHSESSECENNDMEDRCVVTELIDIDEVALPKDEFDIGMCEIPVEESSWISLGTFSEWTETPLKYLIKLMIVQFLHDCIDEQSSLSYLKSRKIRVNSKVLAINCLTQLSVLDTPSFISQLSIGTDSLPSAIDCVLFHYKDDDSQLCGAAVTFMGHLILSQLLINRNMQTNESKPLHNVDYIDLTSKIQYMLDNSHISGQHLKFVLSSLKLFLWELASTSEVEWVLRLVGSMLRYANHNYKLVRKEVIAVCRCVDFRNIRHYEQQTQTRGLIRKMNLSEKCISTMLSLLADVEPDIREDACDSFIDLIDHGMFDDLHRIRSQLNDNNNLSTPTSIDRRRLIPFICSDINVTLTDVRRKLLLGSGGSGTATGSAIHRCLHIVIEQLISTPVPSGKEMKASINKISGCVCVLSLLLEKYPITAHPRLWIGSLHSKKPSLTTTKSLLLHLISLISTPLVMMDISLHNDILYLVSRLILFGGVEHLLLNNLLIDKSNSNSGIVLHLNNDLPLVESLKSIMVHLCRMLNIFWHVFQFITPVMPQHKTVLPNLSSQTPMSPPKKKSDTTTNNKSSVTSENLSSTESRPPRSRSSIGFFVNQSHYMSMYRGLNIAYNSFLISTDSANSSDKLLILLSKTLESLSIIMEIISFNEVSPYVEEFLSYCLVFYNILPTATVEFIIKLLGSLFGTNITAQWDPFISQIFSLVVSEREPEVSNLDISQIKIEQWKKVSTKMGSKLQTLLKNASVTNLGNDIIDIERWDDGLSDTFQWVRASGRRREPGILRQMVSGNASSRPNLSHYIGLFEKHVFQCMRQYLSSPPELQTSIIQLLCQLIYLRVNYCQLDSEQKFLNIILNQLENFTSFNNDLENKSTLIIEIIEFLILITYEKAGTTKRDQPILSLTQVIHSVESLLLNGLNVRSVIIPCLWKIVCDLFVHRSVWLNNPGNSNLLPSAHTSKEIEVQREAVLDLLLRKLIRFPDTFEVLALIVEHSAREHELKWQKLSHQVWSKLSSILFEDGIEFSEPVHIDHLIRLIRVISLKAITCPSPNITLIDLIFKKRDISPETGTPTEKRFHHSQIVQAIRPVVSLQTIIVHNIEYWRFLPKNKNGEQLSQKEFLSWILDLLKTLLTSYHSLVSLNKVISSDRSSMETMGIKLIRMLLLAIIEIKKLDLSQPQGDISSVEFSGLISLKEMADVDQNFYYFKEDHIDISLLWDELKFLCGIFKGSAINIRSHFITKIIHSNNVIQICRLLNMIEDSHRKSCIEGLISNYYKSLIEMSSEKHVHHVLELIYADSALSAHFLDNFKNHTLEITKNTTLMMNWLHLIDRLHLQSSEGIISLLRDYLTDNSFDIRFIVIVKVDIILSSQLTRICDLDNKTSSNITLLVKSLEKMMLSFVLTFPNLTKKLKHIKQHSQRPSLNECYPIDPLGSNTDDENNLDEKKFWRVCVEKSLISHDQDVRLGPRLLQGGTLSDLEEIFQVNLTSNETRPKDHSTPDFNINSDRLNKLPPRFIQQCLRLGFLRSSGGGVVQEGVRVDFIFRLGEKLMFDKLAHMVIVTNDSGMNKNYAIVHSSSLLGLLAALNDYLSLSRQLSVPMPLSSVNGNLLLTIIMNVSILILKSKYKCTRLLIEEILSLMTYCFSSFTQLTNEDSKDLRKDLPWSYISVIVEFLEMVVENFSEYKLYGLKRYPSVNDDPLDPTLATIIKMDKILSLCLQGLLDVNDSGFQCKLKFAIITTVRLPSLFRFSRNPNNIKTFDTCNAEMIIKNPSTKDVLELDCLSKMNRDDLALAQTLFCTLGWITRFMFEETWLIYLNLLHDKGPSAAISDGDDSDGHLSPEEVVEQGHCDSIGLLGVTNMLLKTTARSSPSNPIISQLEHRPRDKTPNLLHTKIGRKLSTIHGQLDEEIFCSHRGVKMSLAGWTISSWNVEREDSILQYRHDQINVNVLAKRISIGSRSPQISGSDNDNLDVLSCLQSLPIIYEQWLQMDGAKKSVALWPRASALRSAVILMDLFSSREQVQWLLDSLLELSRSSNIEDDWITLSWLSIGLSKCVSVLETSSNAPFPQPIGKSTVTIATNTIYGLLPTLKIIETCINSDLTILQQSALHSVMFLLQMTVYGKTAWDLPLGSLVELKNLHDSVINYLEGQLLMIDLPLLLSDRSSSFIDVSSNGSNILISNSFSQAVTSGAANFANTVSGLTSINNMNSQMGLIPGGTMNSNPNQSSLPRLMKANHGMFIRTERHNHLIMATACFYCENYQDALPESDLLNNIVTLAKNIMQTDKLISGSAATNLILCRCLERCFLTQRVSTLVIEQIIRICSNYLKTCRSTTHSLPVLRLFLTSCYLSLANSLQTNSVSGVFESVFYNGPSSSNAENQLVMLERVNIFWKRLTDTEIIDVVESRILSRLISSIMTEFMSGEEILNKTVHQLLRSWPKAQYVAKTLFDIITRCLNQPEGEKLIRKWALMVLPSLTSCRPENLSIWVTTVVLVASGSSSRISLRAIFSQCLDWLTQFEAGEGIISEMETCLFIASVAFIADTSRDPPTEVENKAAFFKAIHSNLNIPTFQKLYSICLKKKLLA